jgi:uncharacterized protein DUF5681
MSRFGSTSAGAMTKCIEGVHMSDQRAIEKAEATNPAGIVSADGRDDLEPTIKRAPSRSPKKTARMQRGRPFKSGKSGNPLGRPKGSRNKTTMAVEALLEGDGEGIARKAVEKALEGDMAALRLCLERLLPPRRDRPVTFELPKIENVNDLVFASSAILKACAAGTLSPGEAVEVMGLISSHVRVVEMTEIEARMTALEKAKPT